MELERLLAIGKDVLGTTIDADDPMMNAGLDSMGVIEYTRQLQEQLGDAHEELPGTLLFDYPTTSTMRDRQTTSCCLQEWMLQVASSRAC